MSEHFRNSMCRTILLVPALLIGGVTPSAICQSSPKAASDLVKALAHPSIIEQAGLKSCSAEMHSASDVDKIVKEGRNAVPELEQALDSLEDRGNASEYFTNGDWVAIAYARILQTAAYPRLRRLAHSQKLRLLAQGLDSSIAISLGLTGYVSMKDKMGRMLFCTLAIDPRLSLVAVIDAWLRKDELALGEHLDSGGKNQLRAVFSNISRTEAQSPVDKITKTGQSAVGFRFSTSREWRWALHARFRDASSISLDEYPKNIQIETQFTDSDGWDCGRLDITFEQSGVVFPKYNYVIHNADLEGLLAMISKCASQGRADKLPRQ